MQNICMVPIFLVTFSPVGVTGSKDNSISFVVLHPGQLHQYTGLFTCVMLWIAFCLGSRSDTGSSHF